MILYSSLIQKKIKSGDFYDLCYSEFYFNFVFFCRDILILGSWLFSEQFKKYWKTGKNFVVLEPTNRLTIYRIRFSRFTRAILRYPVRRLQWFQKIYFNGWVILNINMLHTFRWNMFWLLIRLLSNIFFKEKIIVSERVQWEKHNNYCFILGT